MGPNASGKTNAIEAMQLLTAFASFRGATTQELIRKGESAGSARITVEDGSRLLEYGMNLGEEGRHFTLNGKRRATRELRGTLPSVAFTPDDLNLVKGSNRYRRHELDILGAQLNANYHQLTRDFEKVLRHKNRLLKDEAPTDLIEAANVVYAKVAVQLTSYRKALFERLLPHMRAHYAQIGEGEELTGEYAIEPHAETGQEIMRGRTLWGPHLDGISFAIEGMDAATFASQGQQRSVVLAMKLAEAELVEEMLGQPPVLLLDDVMSELDGSRRKALVDQLIEGKQTFITTANIDYFDSGIRERAKVIEL